MILSMDSTDLRRHQAHGALGQPFPSAPLTPTGVHFVSPDSGANTHSISAVSDHSIKRFRNDSESSDVSSYSICQPAQQQATKKSRGNAYVAPRKVPKSFVSEVGSLAAATVAQDTRGLNSTGTSTLGSSMMRVHLRRQLSGGKLDPFLGDHDAMDVDASDSRPRSMSF